jgi:type II restriction enzyme
VRELDKKEFTLQEMYDFVPKLRELHLGNKHVSDKIRQQLQVLRDNGILEFVSPGKYQLKV